MKARTWVAMLALASASIAVIGAACGGKKDDGGSCDSDSDCKSSRCVDGNCGGSTCTCTTGTVCNTGSSCQDGWACVNDVTGATVATCRRLCPDGKTGCAVDEHCDTDKVCHGGATPPSVVFADEPRPCSAFLDCQFGAKVLGGSGQVDHFTWLFDDGDGGVDTQDGSITHQYGPGSHSTSVTAFDKNGTQGKASKTDDICVDGISIPCSEGVAECCSGACTPEGGCR
jgi:PKD repeat protein